MMKFFRSGFNANYYVAATLALCLLPWLILQPQIRVPGDGAGLTLSAMRALSGLRMVDSYFDNNPPLCFLIFTPAALMTKAGMPLWYAVAFYAIALIAVGITLVAALIDSWPGLTRPVRIAAVSGYAGAVTLPAFYEFGQKDHLIAIMLVPFLLAQWAITQKHEKWPAARRYALILGAPFILVKPQFGLLPVALLIHRAWRRRSLSVVFDLDFLALAIGTILYAALVVVAFPDYGGIVMRYVGLHLSDVQTIVYPGSAGLLLLTLCLGVAVLTLEKSDNRTLALVLTAMAALSVIPFFVQLKGFYLHALPSLILFFCAAVITAAQLGKKLSMGFERYAGAPGIILVFCFLYLAFPPVIKDRTHKYLENAPLALFLKENVQGSSFFLENITTHIIIPTSAYTGIPWASRFPLLWFLPGLAKSSPAAHDFFAQAMAADLNRFHPAIVGLYHRPRPEYNLLLLFEGNQSFANEWLKYRSACVFRLSDSDYPNGLYQTPDSYIDYDIYSRVDAPLPPCAVKK